MRPLAALALVALVAGSLWYLVAPPRTEAAYRERASDTAETLLSQVETARLWAELARDGGTTGPAAAVGIEDAERRATAAHAKFATYQPPRAADDVRRALEELASLVEAELAALRVAARRGEWNDVARAVPELERLGTRLEEFSRRVGA